MARQDVNERFWQGRASYIIAFLVIWGGYFGLIAFFNFKSKYDHFQLAITYQCLFIALAALPVLFLPLPGVQWKRKGLVVPAIWISLILAVLGISSLLIDKMINGVDYTSGICVARYQMNRLGDARHGGVSSVFSVFGNLFATSFFVSVAVAMVSNISRRMHYATFGIAFICLMALSMIASSRSIILLSGAFFVAMICLRLFLHRAIRIRLVDVVFGAGMVACALLFIGMVFECRATMSNMTSVEYQNKFAPFLGVEGSGVEGSKGAGSVLGEDVSGIVGVSALYLIHSAYTFAGILSMPPEAPRVMFQYPIELLVRVGVIDHRSEDWALAGRFTSVPGGLYHDFGFWGMCLGSILMGMVVWAAMGLLRWFPNSIVLVGVASMVFTIMFLSPFHYAAEFASFPFTCFSFIVVGLLAKAFETFFGKRAS